MYQQYFNFTSLPFSIAPNPRFIYLSPQHREALAHLLFGISVGGGGFVALTGEVGTGKTTLCRCLLDQLPEDVDIALVFNPRLSAKELLAGICDELRIPHPDHRASIKQLIDRLVHHLLETHARGRRTVVLIDEAQNLSYDVLEQIRLLTNLETNETKLLQIILVGQPELKRLLNRRNLRQLSQRVTARYHLRPLSLLDTAAYINHRLEVSGATRAMFSRLAIALIYRLSGGVPRLINLICDRALLGAYTLGRQKVDFAIARKAAREALPDRPHRREKIPALGLAAAVVLFVIAHFLGYGPLAGIFPAGQAPEQVAKPSPNPASPSATPLAVATMPSPAPSAAPTASPLAVVPAPEATPVSIAAAAVLTATPAPGADLSPPPDATAQETAPAGQTKRSLADFIGGAPSTRGPAFARLFALWHIDTPTQTTDQCLYASKNGLHCLFLRTDWTQLQALDRPALLEFVLPDGSKRYGALTGFADNKAFLELNSQTHVLPLAEILPFWRGQAVILWKPPVDNVSLRPGEKGETVRWVRQLLQVPADPGPDLVFDEQLKARVMAFQQQHGLLADGRIGPMTLLHLEQLVESPATPKLRPHGN